MAGTDHDADGIFDLARAARGAAPIGNGSKGLVIATTIGSMMPTIAWS